jgi:hypothetical protein
MSALFSVEYDVHFSRVGRGAPKELCAGSEPLPAPTPCGGIGRIARLMALAIRFDALVRSGAVKNYAELATLGHVTTARISQITRLLHLAPDIQEEILFYQRPARGRDPIYLARLQPIAAVVDWKKQRRMWRELMASRP